MEKNYFESTIEEKLAIVDRQKEKMPEHFSTTSTTTTLKPE